MLQAPILKLQGPQVPGRIHVAGEVFGAPAIECADRDPVFPARTCDPSLGTSFPQDLQLFSLLNRDGIRRRFPCATCLGNRVHPSVDKTRLTPLRHIRRTCILTGDSYTAGKPGAHRLLVPFTRQGDGGNARTFVLGRM